MPDLSNQFKVIDGLVAKGVISQQDRTLLRQHLFATNDHDEKIVTTLLNNARDTLAENWKGFVKDLKSGTISGESHAALSALTLAGMTALTVANPALGAASAATLTAKPGQATNDFLVEHGWSPNMAAAVGTIIDSGPQAVMTIQQVKNIVGQGLFSGVDRTSKAQAEKISEPIQNVWNYFRSKLGYGTVTKQEAQQAVQTISVEAAKPSPASQVDVVRPPSQAQSQDTALPGGGVMQTERKALPPPSVGNRSPEETAQVEAQIQGINEKVKAMNRTSDLLAQAQQQTTMAPVESETSKTLAAAKATILGDNTGEMMLNKKDAQALLDRMSQPGAIRGGLTSDDELVQRMMKSAKEYQTNLAYFQNHDVSRDAIAAKADDMISHGFGQANITTMGQGTALNREQTMAMVKTVGPVFDSIIKNRDLAMKGDVNAYHELLGDLADLSALNPRYFGGRSVAGGTLGEYRTPTTATTQALEQLHSVYSAMSGMPINTAEDAMRYRTPILSLLSGVKSRDDLLAMMSKMPDPEAAQKPATWWDFAVNFYINNLLTPASTVAKTMSDASTIMYRGLFEKPLQAYATRPLNNMLNNPLGLQQGDIAVPGEALQYLYGVRSGLQKAASYLGRWDLNGMQQESGLGTYNFMDLGDFLDQRFGMAGRAIGDLSQVTSKGLKIVTNAARIAIIEGENRARLFRQLSEQGYTGEALGNEMSARLPYMPQAFTDASHAVADEYTFTGAMPGFFEWLNQGRSRFSMMKFEVPFFRAIVNWSRWGWNRAPVTAGISNLWDVMQNGRNADLLSGGEAAGKAATDLIGSTILGAGLLGLSRAGYLTGGGLGFNMQRIREMTGINAIQPYSLFGVGYHLAHPFGQIFGTAGDLGEMLNQLPKIDDDSWSKDLEFGVGAFMMALSRNYGDIPALQGITNVARVLDDAARGQYEGLGLTTDTQSSKSFAAARLAEGFIPAGGLFRSVASQVESWTSDQSTPMIKYSQTIGDQLKNDFWGLLQAVPGVTPPKPTYNILGKEQYYPDKIGPYSLSRLSDYSDAKPTPFAQELNRLGFDFGPTQRTIMGVADSVDPTRQVMTSASGGVALTEDEIYNYDKNRKQAFGQAGEDFFNSDVYKGMSDPMRLLQLNKIARQTTEQTKRQMILDSPDLQNRIQSGIDRKQIFMLNQNDVDSAASADSSAQNADISQPPPMPPSLATPAPAGQD